jgi:hypothetical protein
VNKPPLINKYAQIEIVDDILHGTYLPGVMIDATIAKELVRQRLEYSNGVAYPLLIMGEGIRAMNKDARAYLAKEGVEGLVAAALVVNSVYTEFFGNMFLKITQTSIPSKLFTNKEEALKWLEQFKNKK